MSSIASVHFTPPKAMFPASLELPDIPPAAWHQLDGSDVARHIPFSRQKSKRKAMKRASQVLLVEEIRRSPVDRQVISWFTMFYTSKRCLGMGFLNHQQYHVYFFVNLGGNFGVVDSQPPAKGSMNIQFIGLSSVSLLSSKINECIHKIDLRMEAPAFHVMKWCLLKFDMNHYEPMASGLNRLNANELLSSLNIGTNIIYEILHKA